MATAVLRVGFIIRILQAGPRGSEMLNIFSGVAGQEMSQAWIQISRAPAPSAAWQTGGRRPNPPPKCVPLDRCDRSPTNPGPRSLKSRTSGHTRLAHLHSKSRPEPGAAAPAHTGRAPTLTHQAPPMRQAKGSLSRAGVCRGAGHPAMLAQSGRPLRVPSG